MNSHAREIEMLNQTATHRRFGDAPQLHDTQIYMMDTTMRFFVLGLALILLPVLAWAQPAVAVASDDRAMLAAIERARGTVQRVLTQMERGNRQVSVKVRIQDGEAVEHFWLSEIRHDQTSGVFRGKIDNDPQTVRNVALGQLVSVHQAEISDWLYMNAGRMHGNFTLRVVLPTLEAAQAARLRALLSNEL